MKAAARTSELDLERLAARLEAELAEVRERLAEAQRQQAIELCPVREGQVVIGGQGDAALEILWEVLEVERLEPVDERPRFGLTLQAAWGREVPATGWRFGATEGRS